MTKTELKDLVKRYFNLQEIETTDSNIVEEKFAVAHLIDGTKVTNDKDSAIAEGDALFVETAEGEKVQAPVGEHELEDGTVVTVNEEGVITGLKAPGAEGEGSLEAAEEKMSEEKFEDDLVEEVASEDLIQAISELVMPEINAMKSEMANCMERLASYEEKMAEYEDNIKEMMGSKPAAESMTAVSRFAKQTKNNVKSMEPAKNKNRYEGLLKSLTY